MLINQLIPKGDLKDSDINNILIDLKTDGFANDNARVQALQELIGVWSGDEHDLWDALRHTLILNEHSEKEWTHISVWLKLADDKGSSRLRFVLQYILAKRLVGLSDPKSIKLHKWTIDDRYVMLVFKSTSKPAPKSKQRVKKPTYLKVVK